MDGAGGQCICERLASWSTMERNQGLITREDIPMPSAPLISAVLTLALLALPGYAAAIQIEPGKWELTTTASNPMSPQPQTEVRYECMTDSQILPQGLMGDADGCTTSNVVSTDEIMKWDMSCDMDGSQATGQAEFTSTGTSANGRMQITMEFNGHQMQFQRTWDGQRVGPCE